MIPGRAGLAPLSVVGARPLGTTKPIAARRGAQYDSAEPRSCVRAVRTAYPRTGRRAAGSAPAPRSLVDGDLDHLDRRRRPIAAPVGAFSIFFTTSMPDGHLAEHRVLRRTGGEPVEVGVVHGVDEELTAAAVRAGRCWPSTGCPARSRASRRRGARPGCVPSGPSPVPARGLVGILAVRAAELDHEVVDHAVKVQAVVEARSWRSLMKLPRGDRHLVGEELDRDVTERGLRVAVGFAMGAMSLNQGRRFGDPAEHVL